MKIGIVSVGNDSLVLWKFLHNYDHEYVVYYDADARPLGDKTRNRQREIVQSGYDFLVARGCEKVIVPPMGEVEGIGDRVFSLYKEYVMQMFAMSLVGKIGYLTESGHMVGDQNMMQTGLTQWSHNTQRTDAQRHTKSFHWPMVWWGRDVRQWKYFLRSLSPRNYLINKVVKFDLRSLKDAAVDTILPTEWSHFAMEKTIERFFNGKKTKRGSLKQLARIFAQNMNHESSYSVTVYYRGDRSMFESTQKYPRLMTRGGRSDIVFEEINP